MAGYWPTLTLRRSDWCFTRGFTLEQLKHYIQYSRATSDFEKGSRPPWILQRPLWKAAEVPVAASAEDIHRSQDRTEERELAIA